jgi:hypothetical protein
VGSFSVVFTRGAVSPGLAFGLLVAFGPTGGYLFGRSLPAQPEAIAFDASGAMIVAGSFQGVVDLGGGPLTGTVAVWIAKLDAAGQHIWSRSYAAPGVVTALELGPAGEIHLAARVTATADFGGGPLPVTSSQGLVVVKLDPEGGHLWSERIAQPSFDGEVALAVLYAAQLDPSGEEVRSSLFGCSNGFVPSLAFRPGVSEGVAIGATFSRFASLGGILVTSGSLDDVIVGGLGP